MEGDEEEDFVAKTKRLHLEKKNRIFSQHKEIAAAFLSKDHKLEPG